MIQHKVDSFFYLNYFASINYELFNSSNLKLITPENWNNVIPEYGTIDIFSKTCSLKLINKI